MTAVCFGCSGRFERTQLEHVGDTVFCRACLERMLRRVDERGASLARRGEPVSQPPADAPCFICGQPLAGSAFVELRGFAICAACSRGLVGGEDLPASGAANDDRPAPEPNGPSGPSGPRGPRGPRDVLRGPSPPTPGTSTEWCNRCGRAMPGPGSYQLLDGRPHCAACVAARASEPAPAPSTAPAACDACRRAASSLRETRGFWLCLACLDSDPTLALALAQARHRRRLERASRQLLTDDGGEDAS